MNFDILIIGAGISGTMLARELSRYKLKIAVVDKETTLQRRDNGKLGYRSYRIRP